MKNEDRVQPWPANPRYWQYKEKPVLLLGGSRTDHLFLHEGLKEHLDEICEAGANYVRNTMSQREGKELKPHKLLPNGAFAITWISVSTRRIVQTGQTMGYRPLPTTVEGGASIHLDAPYKGGWVAALVLK